MRRAHILSPAAPAIEAKFIALCRYASQFLVFGEATNFCVALIALDLDMIAGWGADQGMSGASYEDLVKSPEVLDLIDGYVEKLNAELNRWKPSRSGRCLTTPCRLSAVRSPRR
jgi:long-chain acyl-CoA synthetase